MTSASPVPAVPATLLAIAREVAHEMANETFLPHTIEVWAADWSVGATEAELAEYRECEGHGAPLYTEVIEPVYEDDEDDEDEEDDDEDEYSLGSFYGCRVPSQKRAWDRADEILSDPFFEGRF